MRRAYPIVPLILLAGCESIDKQGHPLPATSLNWSVGLFAWGAAVGIFLFGRHVLKHNQINWKDEDHVVTVLIGWGAILLLVLVALYNTSRIFGAG